jgi:hypothetical protein
VLSSSRGAVLLMHGCEYHVARDSILRILERGTVLVNKEGSCYHLAKIGHTLQSQYHGGRNGRLFVFLMYFTRTNHNGEEIRY